MHYCHKAETRHNVALGLPRGKVFGLTQYGFSIPSKYVRGTVLHYAYILFINENDAQLLELFYQLTNVAVVDISVSLCNGDVFLAFNLYSFMAKHLDI